jgi:RND family efflux transporter MFP subunit
MPNSQTRSVRHLLAAFLFFLLFLSGCEKKNEEIKKADPAVPVITAEATTRRVEYTLTQVGTLKASQEVTIRSEIEGRIINIRFTEGREVKRGQILVRLNASKIQAEVRNLEARIEQLQIRLANKKRTLERNRPLVERDLVSRQQFDNIQTEIKEIKAEIAQARANLGRQKERLYDTVIRAPFDGVAGARNISPGDYLRVGDPVLTVVDLDPLAITFQVPEKFKPKIFMGQECLLRVDAFPNRMFKGTISFISPQVDVNTRTFLVKARVDNGQHLLNPGMFARVEVITEVHENALTVPWESVIQTEEETYIYIIEDGDVARKVHARLGKVTHEWAEVLGSGLYPGAEVVLEGKYALKDGMKVAVQKGPKGEKAERH